MEAGGEGGGQQQGGKEVYGARGVKAQLCRRAYAENLCETSRVEESAWKRNKSDVK